MNLKLQKMKPSFIIAFYFLFALSNAGFSQTKSLHLNFKFHVSNVDLKKDLEDVVVQFEVDGKIIKTLKTARNGTTQYLMDLGKEYKITFSYGNLVQKFMIVDTRNIDLEKWKFKKNNEVRLNYDVEMELFGKERCQNFDFMNDVAWRHLKYVPEKGDITDISNDDTRNHAEKERKKKCPPAKF